MPVWYAAFVRGDLESVHRRNNPWLFICLPILDPQTPQFRSKLSIFVMLVEKGGVLLLLLFCFVGVSKRHWKCGSSVIFRLGLCVP